MKSARIGGANASGGRECGSGEVSRTCMTKGNGRTDQWKTVEASVDLPRSKIMSTKLKGFETL